MNIEYNWLFVTSDKLLVNKTIALHHSVTLKHCTSKYHKNGISVSAKKEWLTFTNEKYFKSEDNVLVSLYSVKRWEK